MKLFDSLRIHFHIVSTHPRLEAYFEDGVIGRALKNGLFECSFYQLRDFCITKYRSVDGKSFGGGAGRVLKLEPLVNCHDFIMQKILPGEAYWRIFFSPGGTLWQQKILTDWVDNSNLSPAYGCQKVHFILFCGRYEGVDQRFLDNWIDFELSIGPYILSSGDLPTMVFLDSLVRYIPKTLNNTNSLENETILEVDYQIAISAPNYAPPQIFRNYTVPEALISGNPRKVEAFEHKWRLEHRPKTLPKSLTNQLKS